MELFTKIFAGISGAVFLMMLLCGLWLRHASAKPTMEGSAFHAGFGIVTIVMGLILVVLCFIRKG